MLGVQQFPTEQLRGLNSPNYPCLFSRFMVE